MLISLEIKNNNLGILSYLDALIRINEEFFELPVKCSGCSKQLTNGTALKSFNLILAAPSMSNGEH